MNRLNRHPVTACALKWQGLIERGSLILTISLHQTLSSLGMRRKSDAPLVSLAGGVHGGNRTVRLLRGEAILRTTRRTVAAMIFPCMFLAASRKRFPFDQDIA